MKKVKEVLGFLAILGINLAAFLACAGGIWLVLAENKQGEGLALLGLTMLVYCVWGSLALQE